MINMDEVNNLPSLHVASASFKVLDTIQDFPDAMRIAAVAAVFWTLCDVFRVRPETILQPVANLMSDPIHGQRPQFTALRTYAQQEFKS